MAKNKWKTAPTQYRDANGVMEDPAVTQKRQLEESLSAGMVKGRALANDRFSQSNLNAERAAITSPEQAAILKRQEAAASTQNPMIADLLKRRQEGLQGLNSAENTALRTQGTAAVNQSTGANVRNIRQNAAASGVRGGAALAAQSNARAAGTNAQANMERDLLLKNVDIKKNALDSLEGTVGGAEQLRMANENALNQTVQQRDEAARTQVLNKVSTELGIGQGEMGAASSLMQAQKEKEGRKKIVCTILHEQGYMSDYVYSYDCLYGQSVERDVHAGYYVWAKHIANIMDRFPVVSKFVSKIALPWAEHMVYQMGGSLVDNRFGKLLAKIGEPICKFIGRLVK